MEIKKSPGLDEGLPSGARVRAGIPPVRVMVVDDSLVIRGLISRMLREDSRIEVVATAAEGGRAIDRVREGGIEVVVLDIEMPGMDGITAIPGLLKACPKLEIIMASTLSTRNAEISLRALEAGASDYIPKPTSNSEIFGAADFKRELTEKVLALGGRHARKSGGVAMAAQEKALSPFTLRAAGKGRPRILAIGSSTGGPGALHRLLADLPRPFSLPIVITQHMPPMFTRLLAENLSKNRNVECREAADGDVAMANVALIAPGDSHMEFVTTEGQLRVKLNQGPKINYCRPAVDPMLRSLVTHFGAGVLCTILTGMGSDGRAGAEAVVTAGGTVIAQDEPSSVVWGMPGAVARAGLCAAVLPIEKLGTEIGVMIRSR